MKLNPCPFCSSTYVAVVSLAVHCGNCACVGPTALTVEQSVLRLNERANSCGIEALDRLDEEKRKVIGYPRSKGKQEYETSEFIQMRSIRSDKSC